MGVYIFGVGVIRNPRPVKLFASHLLKSTRGASSIPSFSSKGRAPRTKTYKLHRMGRVQNKKGRRARVSILMQAPER